MLSDRPLPEPYPELIARRFAALADPTRIRMLDALHLNEELSVTELARQLGAGHANVSKHLTVMHAQRIVARRKQGAAVIYRIADPAVLALCEAVCGGIRQELRDLEALLEPHGGGGPTTDTTEGIR